MRQKIRRCDSKRSRQVDPCLRVEPGVKVLGEEDPRLREHAGEKPRAPRAKCLGGHGAVLARDRGVVRVERRRCRAEDRHVAVEKQCGVAIDLGDVAVARGQLDQRRRAVAIAGQGGPAQPVGGSRLVVRRAGHVDRVVKDDRGVDGRGILPADVVGDAIEPAENLGDVRRVVIGALRLGVRRGELGGELGRQLERLVRTGERHASKV